MRSEAMVRSDIVPTQLSPESRRPWVGDVEVRQPVNDDVLTFHHARHSGRGGAEHYYWITRRTFDGLLFRSPAYSDRGVAWRAWASVAAPIAR